MIQVIGSLLMALVSGAMFLLAVSFGSSPASTAPAASAASAASDRKQP
jgi:hypothetical protein